MSRSLRRFVPSGANPCSQRMLQSIAAVPWPSRARVSQTRMGTQTVGPGVGCSVRVGSGKGNEAKKDEGVSEEKASPSPFGVAFGSKKKSGGLSGGLFGGTKRSTTTEMENEPPAKVTLSPGDASWGLKLIKDGADCHLEMATVVLYIDTKLKDVQQRSMIGT